MFFVGFCYLLVVLKVGRLGEGRVDGLAIVAADPLVVRREQVAAEVPQVLGALDDRLGEDRGVGLLSLVRGGRQRHNSGLLCRACRLLGLALRDLLVVGSALLCAHLGELLGAALLLARAGALVAILRRLSSRLGSRLRGRLSRGLRSLLLSLRSRAASSELSLVLLRQRLADALGLGSRRGGGAVRAVGGKGSVQRLLANLRLERLEERVQRDRAHFGVLSEYY